MHSAITRANAIFAFAFSCLATLTFLCAMTGSLYTATPAVSLAIKSSHVEHRQQFRFFPEKYDLGVITFDLEADLTSLFHWNTKLLYISLVAEYPSVTKDVNQVVLWDRHVFRHGEESFTLNNVRTEYAFFDYGAGLRFNKNVTVSLHWFVVPHAGLMPRMSDGHVTFGFDDYYRVG